MSEQAAAGESLPYGVPGCRDAWDSVDHVLADWARERPEAPGAGRVALGLTSGTVSVRLDRLARRGIVTREPDPASARGSLVRLTGAGLDLFDQVAPVHLANEDRLLAALSGDERLALAGLLRRLLASFETDVSAAAGRLGLALEPAHLAQQRRQAVGLAHRPGLLVAAVRPGSPGAAAGIERGDLLTGLDGQPVISSTGLALLLDGLAGAGTVIATIVRGNDESSLEIRLPGPS